MASLFFTLTPFSHLLGHAPAGPHKRPGVSITEGREAVTWTCQQGIAWCAKAAASKLYCTDFKHFHHHTCSPPLCVTLLCSVFPFVLLLSFAESFDDDSENQGEGW